VRTASLAADVAFHAKSTEALMKLPELSLYMAAHAEDAED
jgi:hypothetical protein